MRQKIFDGKSWYSPPLLSIDFSLPEISETHHRRVPLRNFLVLWDKKNFDRKSWHYPLKHKIFRYPKFVKHKGSPTKFFAAVRQKIFDGKSWYFPSFLYIIFFAAGNFWNTQQKSSSTKFLFVTLRQKNFDRKSWHNPLKHKIFRYPKFVKHKGSPTIYFGTVRQKNFDGKSWYFPSLLYINFFATGNFWNTPQKCSSTNFFSALWDKNISTENRAITLWSIKFFDTRNFLKHRRVPLRSFLVLWDKTILTKSCDTRPLSNPQHISIAEIFWNTERFLDESFRHCETKIFQPKIVVPFCKRSTEITGRIDVYKNSLKTNSKIVVVFSTVCKVDQKVCSWAKNMPVLTGSLVFYSPFLI